ncbi:hypothetical protein WISP_143488 [Willisornis vidua]|uniref:Uncharacterized protein n=1 Tax=Willisornis vidua TaxID=1566151 RepID=A0ABQ9CLK2_9PASS|nr:hypothetical protein WISP_143488 [Willisornis vidua]
MMMMMTMMMMMRARPLDLYYPIFSPCVEYHLADISITPELRYRQAACGYLKIAATNSSGNIYKCHINALPAKNKAETLTGPSKLGRERTWIEIHMECLKQEPLPGVSEISAVLSEEALEDEDLDV